MSLRNIFSWLGIIVAALGIAFVLIARRRPTLSTPKARAMEQGLLILLTSSVVGGVTNLLNVPPLLNLASGVLSLLLALVGVARILSGARADGRTAI